MTNNNDNLSAVDVVRCVYLARTAARRGDADAARRWQAKADAWLARRVVAVRDDTAKEAENGQAADEPQGVWGRHRAKLGTPHEGVRGFPSTQ